MRRYLESVLAPLAYHDALIVVAALDAGCTTLYSEDLQDRQRIEGLTVVNPFGPHIDM